MDGLDTTWIVISHVSQHHLTTAVVDMHMKEETSDRLTVLRLFVAQSLTEGHLLAIRHPAGVLSDVERHRRGIELTIHITVGEIGDDTIGIEPVPIAIGRRRAVDQRLSHGIERIEHDPTHGRSGSGVILHLAGDLRRLHLKSRPQRGQCPVGHRHCRRRVIISHRHVDIIFERDVTHLTPVDGRRHVDGGPVADIRPLHLESVGPMLHVGEVVFPLVLHILLGSRHDDHPKTLRALRHRHPHILGHLLTGLAVERVILEIAA